MGLVNYVENWSKYETDEPVAEIGNSFTKAGSPTNPAGKFGNGIYSAVDAENINAQVLDARKDSFVFSFYIKTDFAVTNGQAQDALNHDVFCIYDGVVHKIGMYIGSDQTWLGAFNGGPATWLGSTHANLTWLAGALQYFTIAFSRAGNMSSSHTMRIYHEGVLIASSTSSISADTNTTWDLMILFLIGQAAKSVVDNGKLYKPSDDASSIDDVITKDIANKNNEGFPKNNIVMII